MLNEREGGNRASHTKTHGGHSCCDKNFQILPRSDLHQLADDASENYNYIECLFIFQIVHSDSSFHCFNCFLGQNLKNSKKNCSLY